MPKPVAREQAATTRRSPVKPKKKKKLRRILTLGLLLLLIVAGGATASVYWKVDDAINSASSDQRDGVRTLAAGVDNLYHSDKPMSIVILGRDTRKETGSLNTDVMITAVVDPVTKKVTMLSIPRDTRIKIPGYRGYHKINSIYANGEAERRQAEVSNQIPTENGVTLTKKTMEQMLGIPIQYYVEVDFDGFKSIIDELGGVQVNVDRKLVYDDPTDNTHINLEPGLQTLNGEQALGYVRHRHDNRGLKYFSNDFDRNRRQQEVIKAVMDKMTSFEGFTKVFKVIEVAGQHVHTDLSPDQIKGLAVNFKGVNSNNIETLENDAYWNASIGYTLLPSDKLKEIRSTLQTQMGVNDSVAELNDSVTGEGPQEATANSNPVKKKSSKHNTVSSKIDSSKPKESTDPTQSGKQTTSQDPAATPPPDIASPAQPEQGTDTKSSGTEPPPDIVPPANANPGGANTTPPAGNGTNGSNG
ncbi:LCP family protein [Brevibacillus ginsengisoli]|uniref:LCP family protein n=1 Tax=Brevibacillus ginsengisoli TaxID=363854 RepID=UPI003CEB2BE2